MAKWIFLALVLIGLALIVAGLWPYIDGLMAQRQAERLGCIVNSAGAQPCIVDGVDIGPDLARRFNMPFAVVLTIWWSLLGALLVLVGLIGALMALFLRKRA